MDESQPMRFCAASDIPVYFDTEDDGDLPSGRTLAPASASAIYALIEDPKASWAKAVAINVAGRRRVWYAWTDQSGRPEGKWEWNHGARLLCDKIEVGVGEEQVSVEGEIDAQKFEGFPEARVDRSALADEEIMQMYENLKQQI